MNKRVITFLSLFSLVMVLSIYYVMLPSGVTNFNENNELVGNILINADDPYIEGIILERESALKEELDSNLNIMESSDYSATEKVLAAQQIEFIENIIDVEHDMRMSIKEQGFVSAFVEVKEDSIDVLALSEHKTKEEVITIIECVESFYIDGIFRQVYVTFR